jgi:hypothetical protein
MQMTGAKSIGTHEPMHLTGTHSIPHKPVHMARMNSSVRHLGKFHIPSIPVQKPKSIHPAKPMHTTGVNPSAEQTGSPFIPRIPPAAIGILITATISLISEPTEMSRTESPHLPQNGSPNFVI